MGQGLNFQMIEYDKGPKGVLCLFKGTKSWWIWLFTLQCFTDEKTESAFIYRFHKPLDWIGEMEIKCPFLLFKQLFPLLYLFRCNQHPLKSIWSSFNHQKWSPSDHNFEWTYSRLWGDKGCPPFAIHFLSSSVSFLSHCDDSYSCDRGWRWGRW